MSRQHRTALDSEERPWGSWHVIDVNGGYKIKRIHVNPGKRLSLQTHRYRSEHWVIIFGIATATIDGVVTTAGPGDSIDVPKGAKHRLANEATQELVIVEVQHGGYTGEDDIVRLEDDFGRGELLAVDDRGERHAADVGHQHEQQEDAHEEGKDRPA